MLVADLGISEVVSLVYCNFSCIWLCVSYVSVYMCGKRGKWEICTLRYMHVHTNNLLMQLLYTREFLQQNFFKIFVGFILPPGKVVEIFAMYN